jgi:hypothetical protein
MATAKQRAACAKARAAKKRKHRGGKRGDKSKTHKGDLDYSTKRGDKDFHRNRRDVHMRLRRPYEAGH